MSSLSEQPGKAYYVSPRRRLIVFVIWLLLSALLVVPMWSLHDLRLIAVAVLISLGMLSFFAIMVWWYPRLVITSAGIELHHLGSHLATPWDNIASIRLQKGSEGFLLRQPMAGRIAGTWSTFANMTINGAHLYGA